MNLDVVLNIYMLLTAVIGLFLCLYKYVKAPRRVWGLAVVFMLAHFLSDYYWTVYTVIMGSDPNTSELMAYFGWNVSYIVALILTRTTQKPEEKAYFHPLMLLPVPINIAQFCLYMQFGGLFNNIIQGTVCTLIAVLSMQSIIYCYVNRKNKPGFPWIQVMMLTFMLFQYSLWTASCFDFENLAVHPYYFLSVFCFAFNILLYPVIARSEKDTGAGADDNSRIDTRFRFALHTITAIIICVCCAGGYILAVMMKNRLVLGADGDLDSDASNMIAILLFVVSFILVLIILAVMMGIRSYYKSRKKGNSERRTKGKFNFVFTLTITFLLMVFAMLYTSNLLYKAAVTSLYNDCDHQVADISESISAYLETTQSLLWVTADSVDQMTRNGIEQDKIFEYIQQETSNQTDTFDENITGFYGYIRGEYLDGLAWVPPESYDPKSRSWYKMGLEGGGEVVMTPPYVDAQTGYVVISFSKMLSDHESVVSLDVTLNHLQETVSDISIKGSGYGMVIDGEGMIIAHRDAKMNGRNCNDIFGNTYLLDRVIETGTGHAEISIDGNETTLFVSRVKDLWYTVIIIDNQVLLADIHLDLIRNICVYVVIFLLITFFYYMSYMNEQNADRAMEELIIEKQKQEYEAKVLKLEKSAADEANQAKSRFLADMSHEIRTPINAVLGMNEMIMRETENDAIREYSANIRTSGRALLNLINSILDFSKIEDGKMEIIPVDYNTADLIHYLYNSVAERAADKNLSFNVDIDPTIPAVLHGDDMRVGQVIMNLLTNAVKYTKEGSVRMSINNRGRDGDDIRLEVSVSDTGIGIRQEDMSKLFESFERLDKEQNRAIEGTGLGMAIVTRLLTMMGSELKVESEYGKGSTFSFVIKQGIAGTEELGKLSLHIGEGSSATARADVYRESFRAPEGVVLIVDDTTMNLKVAVSLLKKTQLQIDTASSGQEAITLCADKKYDVILMDQRMPGMDGTQTLEHIRALDNCPNADTPVICLTADAIRGARDKYLGEGFSDYLTKPIDSSKLEKLLVKYLPSEKILPAGSPSSVPDKTPEPANSAKETVQAGPYDGLKACGIDPDTALSYCQNDDEIFRDVIQEYAKDYPVKSGNITKYYEAADWENYSILVHSLKSTSKFVGALRLSEMAATLEDVSRKQDETGIRAKHDEMMALYKTTAECIRETFGITEEDSASSETDEDTVIEFSPNKA